MHRVWRLVSNKLLHWRWTGRRLPLCACLTNMGSWLGEARHSINRKARCWFKTAGQARDVEQGEPKGQGWNIHAHHTQPLKKKESGWFFSRFLSSFFTQRFKWATECNAAEAFEECLCAVIPTLKPLLCLVPLCDSRLFTSLLRLLTYTFASWHGRSVQSSWLWL